MQSLQGQPMASLVMGCGCCCCCCCCFCCCCCCCFCCLQLEAHFCEPPSLATSLVSWWQTKLPTLTARLTRSTTTSRRAATSSTASWSTRCARGCVCVCVCVCVASPLGLAIGANPRL